MAVLPRSKNATKIVDKKLVEKRSLGCEEAGAAKGISVGCVQDKKTQGAGEK